MFVVCPEILYEEKKWMCNGELKVANDLVCCGQIQESLTHKVEKVITQGTRGIVKIAKYGFSWAAKISGVQTWVDIVMFLYKQKNEFDSFQRNLLAENWLCGPLRLSLSASWPRQCVVFGT
mmetsp:Transcript_31565/g.71734  ORF Transcript_31565/g.71734 Transcript_31565/m.71734 type:complete len:121 (-) Transcript_31565:48-410(-)